MLEEEGRSVEGQTRRVKNTDKQLLDTPHQKQVQEKGDDRGQCGAAYEVEKPHQLLGKWHFHLKKLTVKHF